MKLFLQSLVVTLLFGVLAVYLHLQDYNQPRDFSVTAEGVVSTSSKKSSTLYGIYKLNEDYKFSHRNYEFKKDMMFSTVIGPVTYSQLQKGQRYIIRLRPFDIKQTPLLNAIYFFGTVLSASIFLTGVLHTAVAFFKRNKKGD